MGRKVFLSPCPAAPTGWCNHKRTDGSFQDIVHPVTVDLRKHIESKVLEAYERTVKEKGFN